MNARLRRGVMRLREVGPVNLMRWGLVRAESAGWERYFHVGPFDRGVYDDTPESIPYEPLPWCLIRAAMDVLPMTREDVFLDYGCGMGRVLLLAARREVKRVIGLEFLPALAHLAQKNVAAASARLHSPVEVVVADAATWKVPDDVTVAFLFNPFVGTAMAATQRHLVASLRRKPRRLRILFAHPQNQANLFEGCPWFRMEKRVEAGVFQGMNVLLYESRPMPLFVPATDEEGIAPPVLGVPTEVLPNPRKLSISEGWLTEHP